MCAVDCSLIPVCGNDIKWKLYYFSMSVHCNMLSHTSDTSLIHNNIYAAHFARAKWIGTFETTVPFENSLYTREVGERQLRVLY